LKTATRNFLRYWLPALLWTALVFFASTDTFSAEHTGGVLAFVLAHTVGEVSETAFSTLHFLVRKAAHVTEYGILALMWFRAWRGPSTSWQLAWARESLAICLAVAGVDEFHQSFAASRGSDMKDVVLDTMGAILFLTLAHLIWKYRHGTSLQPAPAGGE